MKSLATQDEDDDDTPTVSAASAKRSMQLSLPTLGVEPYEKGWPDILANGILQFERKTYRERDKTLGNVSTGLESQF